MAALKGRPQPAVRAWSAIVDQGLGDVHSATSMMELLRCRAHSTGCQLAETRLRCEWITVVTGVAAKVAAAVAREKYRAQLLLVTCIIERQDRCLPEISSCLQSDDAVEKPSISGEGIVDVAPLGIGGFSSGEGSSSGGWGLGLGAKGGGQFGVHCSRECFMPNIVNRRFICSGWLQPRAHGAILARHGRHGHQSAGAQLQRSAPQPTKDSPSYKKNVWSETVASSDKLQLLYTTVLQRKRVIKSWHLVQVTDITLASKFVNSSSFQVISC